MIFLNNVLPTWFLLFFPLIHLFLLLSPCATCCRGDKASLIVNYWCRIFKFAWFFKSYYIKPYIHFHVSNKFKRKNFSTCGNYCKYQYIFWMKTQETFDRTLTPLSPSTNKLLASCFVWKRLIILFFTVFKPGVYWLYLIVYHTMLSTCKRTTTIYCFVAC